MTSSGEGPSGRPTANKAKMARRVVEVLDYFDDAHREASVMDIARRYKRPQSSTSELLSSLVDLGLLLKNPGSRTYRLAPRAALLGTGGQAAIVREGGLGRLLDRLAAHTGLSVALFGMVGLNSQIALWRPGPRCDPRVVREFQGGKEEPLSESAAGWLLLSTLSRGRRDGILHRLNSEAPEGRKFSVPQRAAKVAQIDEGSVICGPAGFGSRAMIVAGLIPFQVIEQPLAVGLIHGQHARVDPDGLKLIVQEGLRHLNDAAEVEPGLGSLSTAA